MNKTGRGVTSTVGSGPSRRSASPLGEAPTSGEPVVCSCLFLSLLILEERQLAAQEQQLQRAHSSHLWRSCLPVDRELHLSPHFLVLERALRTGPLVS